MAKRGSLGTVKFQAVIGQEGQNVEPHPATHSLLNIHHPPIHRTDIYVPQAPLSGGGDAEMKGD